jgi:hypothetical protein
MTSTQNDGKPHLLAVYAPGLSRWLARGGLREHALSIALVAVFALCVGAYLLLDLAVRQSSLGYKIGSDVTTAVLVATTVGLFYELVARASMTRETIKVVTHELTAFREVSRGSEYGLVGFGPSRRFFHEDVEQHLATMRSIKVMAIHASRVWANHSIQRAIVGRRDVQLEALFLTPDSHFIESRVGDYPEVYDYDVMRDQIRSHIRMLDTWQKRKGGDVRVKTYDMPPAFWLIFIDDVLYLSDYGRGLLSQDTPVYKFDDRQRSLYHMFHEYFVHVWACAVDAGA